MSGKRIVIRRGRVEPHKPPSGEPLPYVPDYEDEGEGLAVYRVMRHIRIGRHSYEVGNIVTLPYTEEFYSRHDLLLLRVIQA